LISLKEALHFRDHIWEEKFSGPEQIKFLENMSNHIDVFSVPIFDIALDILKKDIEWSGPDGIFATIFIINEVIAKYRLPEDMEKKVREFLEYIIEDYKKYHKPVILAKEGLELLTYNHKTDPIEESYIATAKKCTVVAKEKITKAFVANVAILIMICFIIFWLS